VDDRKQFETMAIIRAYAKEIVEMPSNDGRPTTAHYSYCVKVQRMYELQKALTSSPNG
jgi:hypothetical protein